MTHKRGVVNTRQVVLRVLQSDNEKSKGVYRLVLEGGAFKKSETIKMSEQDAFDTICNFIEELEQNFDEDFSRLFRHHSKPV